MKLRLGVVSLLALTWGCALISSIWKPVGERSASEEEPQIQVPLSPPRESLVVPGQLAGAISVVMEDFLPAGVQPPPDATPFERCLYQRENYEVTVWRDGGKAPDAGVPDGGEPDAGSASPDLIFVLLIPRFDICVPGESPPLDSGAIYGVDPDNWRIVLRRPQ